MRIVAISDTHGYHRRLTIPDGDMLICAGDFSMRAKLDDVVHFAQWFNKQPHQYKIIVPGNHDVYCETDAAFAREAFAPATYLCHEEKEVAGYRVFGSPYSSSIYEPSPWCFDYAPKGPRSEAIWSQIPDGIDILITHGPPKGILDKVFSPHMGEDAHVGDNNLLERVKVVQPRIHIFGHIHEGYGVARPDYSELFGYDDPQDFNIEFYNVSVCDVHYQPTNPVTIIDF